MIATASEFGWGTTSSVNQRHETSASDMGSAVSRGHAQPPSAASLVSTVATNLPSEVLPEAMSRLTPRASLTRMVTATGADEVTSKRTVLTVEKRPQYPSGSASSHPENPTV